MLKLNRSGYTPIPLKKRDDVGNEVEWQSKEIIGCGNQVIHVARTKLNEMVIIYREFFGDDLDETTITLKARVITDKGVKVPDPRMYLHYDPEDAHLMIADLQVNKEDANRGYGSTLMAGMFETIRHFAEPVKYISGWISSVDWGHIDRSVRFYTKHGFECSINHHIQRGDILWVNPEEGGSVKEFKRMNADRGEFPGE